MKKNASTATPVHPVTRAEAQEKEAAQRRQIESLTQELRQAHAREAFTKDLARVSAPPTIRRREKQSGMREMTFVVLASDWHVEEPVDPIAVQGRNSYNLDIADIRVRRFFQAIEWNVEHQRASGKIALRDGVLWLGGDLMTGYIHPELVESNQLSPTETMRWLMPRLRSGIASLVHNLKLDRLVIPCSYGNHGRTTDKRRIGTGAQNSFEWLMYHNLADRFEGDPRVRFEVTKSPHQYVRVYDRVVHFHHGDDVRYQGGVGGLGIPLLKAVPAWNAVVASDLHCIGHHHQLRDYGKAIVNGSLIGYGPYSQSIRADFEEPGQAMFYLDSKRWKTMVTPLWVGEGNHPTAKSVVVR